MSVISAGQLRHQVTVLTPVNTVDEFGQRTQTFIRGSTLFAEVRAVGATETNYADGAAMRTTYQVKCRWHSGTQAGVSPLSVLEYRDRKLQVSSFHREREEEDVMLITAVEIA
jgi:head-tail adaptor